MFQNMFKFLREKEKIEKDKAKKYNIYEKKKEGEISEKWDIPPTLKPIINLNKNQWKPFDEQDNEFQLDAMKDYIDTIRQELHINKNNIISKIVRLQKKNETDLKEINVFETDLNIININSKSQLNDNNYNLIKQEKNIQGILGHKQNIDLVYSELDDVDDVTRINTEKKEKDEELYKTFKGVLITFILIVCIMIIIVIGKSIT
jgi:hypothetical protein